MPESNTPPIDRLIQKARQGDDACRDRLFEMCRSYLGLVARAQVESWLQVKADASDIVQETMLEAYRDFDRFQGDSEKQWMAWLRKILSHNVADYVRQYRGTAKRQVGREVRFRDPADSREHAGGAPEPQAPRDTPSQELIHLDDELRVAAALGELPSDYQEVIMLRNLRRLSFNEVAEQMGRSRPAVQMLWMRAIKRLQGVVGAE